MKRTAIYMRVSSDKQAQEGDSIPAQRDALLKYIADRPDLILAGEYLDDGISGQKYSQRDELQRLLDDVRAGDVNLIIFTKLDRWFRSVRHYTATQEILDKYNVAWLAIWEPIYDTTTPAGRLIVNQMMSIAQFEAENTGQRINQIFAYKVKQGEVISGNTALGHKIVGKHLQPNEDAPIVKDLFEYYNYNGSLAGLTRYAIEKYGIRHDPSTWRKFLKNKKYIGEFRDNPNYCPPIVSRELFESVQRRLGMNIKDNHRKRTYLFTGLLICYGCGKPMTGAPISYRSKNNVLHKYKGYRCNRHYSPAGATCRATLRRFESTLENHLVKYVKDNVNEYILEKEKEKIIDNSARIAAINKKLDKLKDLYVNGFISIEEYKSDREKYYEELEQLKPVKKHDFSKFDVVREMNFSEIYWDFTDEEKRFLWRSIIKEIHWDESGNIDVIFLP